MNGIIWLWKHRHCWKQLKYLYEHRYALNLALGTSESGDAEKILACLGEFDRVPLTRPMPSRPTQLPGSKGRVEKAMVFPTTDAPNSYLNRLDPKFQTVPFEWLKEKAELLKTHAGWFVAYQNGKRVALEPDCDKLVKALGDALGEERRPVTFYEIVDEPTVHRGPSPRYAGNSIPNLSPLSPRLKDTVSSRIIRRHGHA